MQELYFLTALNLHEALLFRLLTVKKNQKVYQLGFTKEDDPVKIEYDLMKVLPKDHWILYNIQIITLGRSICTARNPKCTECFLSDLCKGSGK